MSSVELSVPGIRNLGNTCYWGSALQALASSSRFLAQLDKAVDAEPSGQVPLAESLRNLLLKLQPSRGAPSAVDPSEVLRALRGRISESFLQPGEQQDAAEALELLIDAVEEELQAALRRRQTPQHHWGRLPDATQRSALQKRLAEWRLHSLTACTGYLTEEIQCTSCRSIFTRQATAFRALQLPLLKGRRVSLLECLSSRIGGLELVDSVSCTRCSLAASLRGLAADLESHPLSREGSDITSQSSCSSSDEGFCVDDDSHHAEPLHRSSRLDPLKTLLQLNQSQLPLPDLECLQELAHEAGLAWVPRQTTVAKSSTICRTPEVLLFHLKRSVWTSSGLVKLTGHVGFPLQLCLSTEPLISGYSMNARKSGRDAVDSGAAASGAEYSLLAVVVHSGESGTGHYQLFRRGSYHAAALSPETRLQDGQENHERLIQAEQKVLGPPRLEHWLKISDREVRRADTPELLACEATLLLYERKERRLRDRL